MRRKIMMLTLAGMLGILMTGPVAWAQSAEGSATGDVEQQANLQLSDDQKTKIKDIRKGTHDQVKAIKNDTALTREQKREKIGELTRNSNQQIRGVLTPEQQQRYDRRQRDRREDGRDRREDVRDRREDRRDAQHDGGVRDQREDRRDRREDVGDRREDRHDRKHGSKPPKAKRPLR